MFLISGSALVGLIITMIIILITAMVVLGILMAWYLTKGNTNKSAIISEGEPKPAPQIKEVQPKEAKPVKEPKSKKQDKVEVKEAVAPAVVPYGEGKNTTAFGDKANAPYGEAKANVPYGEGKSNAPYGSGAYGAGYGSDEAEPQNQEDAAYGTKKPKKLANVAIELPKNDWGTKSLFERVSGLSNEQKTLYERARYLLKSRLTNYTTDICEVYFNGEVPAARLIVYKSQILLFISIPTADVSKEKFHVKDTGNSHISNGLPTLLLLRTMDQVNGIERLVDKIIVE